MMETDASEGNANNNEDTVSPDTPKLHVGVGASAGGLEALREFFSAMPSDTGMAFIVVQHLSPDYKSLMSELLAKHTAMPVENVTDGVKVKADSIYLIPPRKNMLLAEGSLYLSEQMSDTRVNLPIDVFFRSLAEDVQHRAAAVIMSGTGSDGTRGIKAVKEAGGLVLVQDPDSAQFDGMPYSAVSTGLSDFVLTPTKIADYLTSYIQHPLVAGSESPLRAKLQNNDTILQEIFALLRGQSRIDFSHYKASTVARRIERRMGINQIVELKSYLTLLQNSDKEVDTLARELLINVTRFFRDPDSFDSLENQVVRRLVESAGTEQEIRVWIAGCSTGEEAFSVAIMFDEAIRAEGNGKRVKIFATDVDASAIAEASVASFSADILADMSPERLTRYFLRVDNGYTLHPDMRQMVVFATHNMITDPPFSNIDLICCRNVLIYFQHAVQQKVMAAFHFSLKKGGILFLGSSETVGELKSHFDPVNERFRIFRKTSNSKFAVGSVQRDPGTTPISRTVGLPPVANLLRSYRAGGREMSFDHIKDRLISDYVPACLILDSEHNAIHVYGDASRYLTRFPSGRVSTNLHDIIADELGVPISTALNRAENEVKKVHYTNVQATIDSAVMTLDLQAEFFEEKNGRPAHFTLIISDTQKEVSTGVSTPPVDVSEQTQQRIRDLENELLNNQEHLQVTNEELETTNEELQAANEELMSSNEELQSSNEELQSVNEELFTVNHEYQEKIAELSVANDDLDNVLSFTSTGIIFLDQDMRIRRFTEVSTHVFNLLPSDIGRPLHHISHELAYPRLFQDIAEVSYGADSVGRHIKTTYDHEIFVRINPYASTSDDAQSKLRGAIITLSNVMPKLEREAHTPLSMPTPSIAGNETANGDSILNVLLVDDSDSDRIALQRHLSQVRKLKLNVVEADSVQRALEQLELRNIDVCLVDYRLGLETAKDFAREAATQENNIPVILISGFTRGELRHELEGSPLTHFINKQEMSPLLLELAITNALELENDANEEKQDSLSDTEDNNVRDEKAELTDEPG